VNSNVNVNEEALTPFAPAIMTLPSPALSRPRAKSRVNLRIGSTSVREFALSLSPSFSLSLSVSLSLSLSLSLSRCFHRRRRKVHRTSHGVSIGDSSLSHRRRRETLGRRGAENERKDREVTAREAIVKTRTTVRKLASIAEHQTTLANV